MQKDLKTNVPQKNNATAASYTAIIRFVVGIDGKLYRFTTETNVGFGMNEEVIMVLKNRHGGY